MADFAQFERREMLQAIAALIGAAALPAEALAAPRRRGGRAPVRFFAPSAYATLVALADTLIPATDTPGALAAQVPQKIDRMMRVWASAGTRSVFVGGLASLNAAALAAEKATFTALTPDRRKAFLLAHEPNALKPVPRTDKLVGFAAMLAGPAYADAGYGKLKELIVATYYISEIGMTRELIYEHVPGKWVPSLKITPETRPAAGTGPF